MQELNLISGLNKGDEQSFNELYLKFYKPLRYFAGKLIDNKQEAEDLVTEAMVKVWQRRQDFTHQEQVKSFLYTAVHRSSLNVLRDRKRHKEKELGIARTFADEEQHTFFDQLLLTEFISFVVEAVESLPPTQKKVFKMIYFEGLTAEEVSGNLGMSAASVYMNKKRALKFLSQFFKDIDPIFLLLFMAYFK